MSSKGAIIVEASGVPRTGESDAEGWAWELNLHRDEVLEWCRSHAKEVDRWREIIRRHEDQLR